jgi:hypothetical protein
MVSLLALRAKASYGFVEGMRLTLTNAPATRAFIRALIAAAIIDALAGGLADDATTACKFRLTFL